MTVWLDFINRDESWATWGLVPLAVLAIAVMVRCWSIRNRRAVSQSLREKEQARLRDL